MPNIKDKSTVEAIAREFCGNGRNKTEAMRTIGYKDGYCDNRGTTIVYTNSRVIAAIKAIDDKNHAKANYDYDIAMAEIDALIASCYDEQGIVRQCDKGLLLSAIKEKNCITGLQQQTVNNKGQGLNITIAESKTYPRKADIKEQA